MCIINAHILLFYNCYFNTSFLCFRRAAKLVKIVEKLKQKQYLDQRELDYRYVLKVDVIQFKMIMILIIQ